LSIRFGAGTHLVLDRLDLVGHRRGLVDLLLDDRLHPAKQLRRLGRVVLRVGRLGVDPLELAWLAGKVGIARRT